jgi:uncharacterized protein YggE
MFRARDWSGMRRLTLPTLAVAALLVLAGCAGMAETPAQQATTDSPDSSGPTIAVSASAEVAAAPDRAVVRVAVVRTAASADAARGGLADDVAAVRTALREAGVPDDAVETTSFGVTPVYDRPRAETGLREPTGYRATHALAVDVPVDDAGRTVDVAVGAGADEVYGVEFTLSDERRADLRSEAVARAVDSARADATAAARAAGLSVDTVRTVTVEDDGSVSPFFARAEAADAGGQTTFDPAPATVRATVRVTYAAS